MEGKRLNTSSSSSSTLPHEIEETDKRNLESEEELNAPRKCVMILTQLFPPIFSFMLPSSAGERALRAHKGIHIMWQLSCHALVRVIPAGAHYTHSISRLLSRAVRGACVVSSDIHIRRILYQHS
jgi:hypothetical protein